MIYYIKQPHPLGCFTKVLGKKCRVPVSHPVTSKVWKRLHVEILEDLCQEKKIQATAIAATGHSGQKKLRTNSHPTRSPESIEINGKIYYFLSSVPHTSEFCSVIDCSFTEVIYFILWFDEMLKMTSCWILQIQPIPRTLLFGISFWIRFRLSIFSSIFICIEIDASVFLAVWAAAVATEYFTAAWARVEFNVIIWKVVFFLFFPPQLPCI